MKKDFNFKSFLPVLIPLIAAILVVSTLAVSGRIAKNSDEKSPTATRTQQAVTQTEIQKEQDAKVSIVAVGDNLIHNTLIAAGMKDDGSLDYTSFYEDISEYIKPADIAIINQETMLGGSSFEYAGYPNFNSPWEVGEAAIGAGFDVFTCATNHSMDIGIAGIEKEVEFFKKHPEVTHIGTYASQEEYDKITYYEKNGITFALLNYTQHTNGIGVPENKSYAVKMLKEELVKKEITEARKNADVVIVLPHWEQENSHEIIDFQRKYVKLFSDLGVDIVIGTHPHVLQPVEWVTNAETGKKMLVYYSIGNFISHQTNRNQMVGGMAEITVERKNGEIEITNAKLAPVIDFYKRSNGKYKFSVYKFCDYNDELASEQAQDGLTVKYAENLAKKIVSEEFLDLN
ncbi:MAG: CapA family protein [Eubacterium sp.]|nr:CapA family protein [Eubacterium sp.]